MSVPRQHASLRAGILPATLLLIAVLVPGCTSHYRASLESYRATEPSPFYQRTLEWAESEGAQSEAPAPDGPPLPEAADTLQVPEATNRPVAVAARVLGTTPDAYNTLTATLASEEARDAALANSLNWQTLLLVVAQENPGVARARAEWEATLNQYSQAEFLEGLLQEFKGFTRYLNLGAGPPLQKDMNQNFAPYPGSLALKGEMIREQVRLAELAWEQVLRDTLVDAGSAYFDYAFQFQGAGTVKENISILEDLIGVVQDRYATGLATQPDVLRLQAELERQRKLLLDFQARQRSLSATLNALLGRSGDRPLGRPAGKTLRTPTYTVDALEETALAHRQEVLAQEARVSRSEIAIRMGEIMNRPPFSQGYSTLDRGMMAEASVGTPGGPFGADPDPALERPAYAQAEAYLRESRSRLDGERETLTQVQLDTRAMTRTLLEQADIATRQTELVRDIVLPLSQSTYEISLSNYKVGSMTFLDLLDAQSKLINTRLELDESFRDRNQAILQVAKVRGYLDNLAR